MLPFRVEKNYRAWGGGGGGGCTVFCVKRKVFAYFDIFWYFNVSFTIIHYFVLHFTFCYSCICDVVVHHLTPLHDVKAEVTFLHRTAGVLSVNNITNCSRAGQRLAGHAHLSG